MHIKDRPAFRLVAAVAIATTTLIAGATSVLAAGDAQQHMQEMTKHRQDSIADRLEHLANRLEIKASQQDAWRNYAAAVQSLGDRPAPPPVVDADAATLVRSQASAMAERAQKLSKLADATAQLQSVLTPQQRTTLDQAARQMGRFAHGKHHAEGFGGPESMGDHEHCEHGGDGHAEHPFESRP